jgi:APA family basic amino acid/polyamine antiporter
MSNSLFATKPVIANSPHVDAGVPAEGGSLTGDVTLKRVLTARHLVMLGIGGVIGAGIFVMTGQAAAQHAGPAIMLSFVLAGFACAMAGLCYAEFAAMLPVSGSAYSYAYATLGEIVAWFIGWNLILEYMFAASTVAVGWSGYLNSFLHTVSGWVGTDVAFPNSLASAPLAVANGHITQTGSIVNLPAVAIVVAISWVCYRGVTQSAALNAVVVAIKLTVIMLFLAFSIQYVNPENWIPFVPPANADGEFGWSGVTRAASIVFFAYIGFDAVSTAAQEAKNPQRDMPIGILGSLIICTILYIVMSGVLTGMLPYTQLGTEKPVATALAAYPDLLWLKTLVEIAAIAGLSSVILVMLMAQPRIFYAMASDGLISPFFKRLHATYRTPYAGQAFVGVFSAILAGLLPISVLGDLVSMGTLLAFATVCIGVLVLRYSRPDLPRAFRVPVPWLVCPLGAITCLYLFWQAFKHNWHWMGIWIIAGMAIYFVYGRKHSKLRG